MKKLGKVKRTKRGFQIIHFKDLYGSKCELQQSSLAELEEPGSSAVWLGVEDVAPQILASDAKKLGIETQQQNGWIAYNKIPEEVLLSSRMHLNRKQVLALIQHLKNWLIVNKF